MWTRIWKWIWFPFVTAILFALVLALEWLSGTFLNSHVVIMAAAFVLVTVFWIFKGSWRWFVDLIGLEEDFRRGNYTNSVMVRLEISLIVGFLISFYLLLSGAATVIPPVLQFSIIPITATLGGLVIAGANYSKISKEQRNELLRVAQKLIVATISFMLFASFFFLATLKGNVNLFPFPTGGTERVLWFFYLLAVLLFFFGTNLFALGIIDLALGLKNLKRG